MKNPETYSKRIKRLDNAFLFILSSIGIVISFIQITLKDMTGIMEVIPFILLGIIFPFYVGYMRGAIEVDSSEERLRGWIYFIIGTSSYFAFFITSKVRIVHLFEIIIFSSLLITYLFLKWSSKVFAIKNAASRYAFSGTSLCALWT